MAEWTQNVIWWHVYPLGALGADTTGHDRSPEPRLRRLVVWLDHLIVLGANGLALGPVFASSTHGYDTIDYLNVDPRLGTNDDLVYLVDEAHRRGIRVMLDGVFNHVGPEFPALVAALHDPDLPDAALFRHDPDGSLATFEGHDGLIALNHDSPRTADLVVEVMTHWLDLGVDAWRLDAAYSVPTPFWAGVLPRVRERHPDAYVVGEVLHGDYADIVAQGTLDSVTQYELWQAIWHGLQSANFHELAWALKRHNTFLETFVPYTFVGNHDVTRIASQIDDERHHAHATVLLFLLGGTPAVYYGDEVGLTGVKQERFGGDDAIRPALPADPDELTRANPAVFALHQQLIGLRRRLPWLHRATSTSTTVDDRQLVLEVSSGDDLLVVALNIGDETLVVDGAWEVLEASDAGPDDRTVRVGPHGWAVLAPGS